MKSQPPSRHELRRVLWHATATAVLAAFSVPALAQDTSVFSVGTVTRLTPHQGDVVIFAVSGPRANNPACSTMSTEWAVNIATPTGRAMYGMLLAASVQNRQVRVVGWGTCLSWTQRAEPGWMQFEG